MDNGQDDLLMDAAKSDVNGDQNMKYEDGDIFGCVTINNQYFATSLITAAGLRMTTKENGTHHAISSQNTDVKAYSAAIDKAIELWQSPAFLSTSGSNTQSSLTNGQALFISEVLTVARRITDENARFSIVPIPKYSEDQENYAQLVCTTGAGLKVSASITDIKATADFLEVFGYHSEKFSTPLTSTIIRHSASARMNQAKCSISFSAQEYGNMTTSETAA